MRGLRDIYSELYSLGIVRNGRQFGEWLNRGESYLSSSLSRNRRPSTEALLALVSNVSDAIDATNEELVVCTESSEIMEYKEGVEALKKLESETWSEIWKRVG